jgi:hypothetical protein
MEIRHIRRAILCTGIVLSMDSGCTGRPPRSPFLPIICHTICCSRVVTLLDDKNKIDAVRDVGIKDAKVAAVAEHLDSKDALKTIDVAGVFTLPLVSSIFIPTSTREQESAVRMQAICLSIPMPLPCATVLRPLLTQEVLAGETSTISRTRPSIVRRPVFSPNSI